MQEVQLKLANGQELTIKSIKRLVTDKGNFLIRVLYSEKGKASGTFVLFYTDPTLKVRYVNKKEIKHVPKCLLENGDHPYLDYAEWNWASENMKDVSNTQNEIDLIMQMAENVLNNPLFGFPDDVIEAYEKDKKSVVKKAFSSTGGGVKSQPKDHKPQPAKNGKQSFGSFQELANNFAATNAGTA